MTFQEFQATRTLTQNLESTCANTQWDSGVGHMYLNALGIKILPSGYFHLSLYGEEWCSDDLAVLEMRLYQFAVAEGYTSRESSLRPASAQASVISSPPPRL